MSLLSICQWLNDSAWGTGIRESIWVFPIIETIHVLGLALSVGTIAVVDLRLYGVVLKREPVSELSSQLMPWSLSGFAIMFLTGTLLFLSQATKAYNSTWFRLKLAFLLLAGINALVFQLTVYRTMSTWDKALAPPRSARLAGLFSLILWICVIAAGRTMAYNF